MPMTTEQKFAKAYTSAGGRNAGAFPWAAILEALMQFLNGCTTPNAAKRWARNHPKAAKEAIAGKLKEDGTFKATGDREAAVDAAYATLLGMTNAELQSYMP